MGGQRVLESFVARIWLEREPNGGAMWRGHIRHVQSDREGHFQDLQEMRAFLERVTGVPGPAAEPVVDLGRGASPAQRTASKKRTS